MKSKTAACALVIVILVLVLPALIGCSSGGSVVQAKPQNPADLPMPDQSADAFE